MMKELINQSINRLINQSINQSISYQYSFLLRNSVLSTCSRGAVIVHETRAPTNQREQFVLPAAASTDFLLVLLVFFSGWCDICRFLPTKLDVDVDIDVDFPALDICLCS